MTPERVITIALRASSRRCTSAAGTIMFATHQTVLERLLQDLPAPAISPDRLPLGRLSARSETRTPLLDEHAPLKST